jgi:hypothetical protein
MEIRRVELYLYFSTLLHAALKKFSKNALSTIKFKRLGTHTSLPPFYSIFVPVVHASRFASPTKASAVDKRRVCARRITIAHDMTYKF